MRRKITNIACAAVILLGIGITSSDGIILLFGCAKVWQYIFNLAFICLVLPACIALSDLTCRAHPEYYETDSGHGHIELE